MRQKTRGRWRRTGQTAMAGARKGQRVKAEQDEDEKDKGERTTS